MVLVAAMMVMALLSILCVAGFTASTLEVKIAAHDRDAKQAFYLCEAGLEKVKFEVLNGWGLGTGGTSAPNYTFTFDAATMPAAAKTSSWWGSSNDKWVNFKLVDQLGTPYTITANPSGSYSFTLAPGPASAPANGRASLYYEKTNRVYDGSGTAGPNQMTPAAAVTANAYDGHYLIDSAGNEFAIVSNTTTILTLDATPAGGAFTIFAAKAGAGTLTIAPGLPNVAWDVAAFNGLPLYVVDTGANVFRVTSAVGASNSRVQLNLEKLSGSTTPQVNTAMGSLFQLTTNPWLVSPPATSVTTYGASNFPVPSGTDYGSVQVAISRSTLTTGTFLLRATAGPTGTSQQVTQDVLLQTNGAVQFRNWREGT